MVFYATFNSISVISRQQITLFMSSWVSPVLGWGSEVFENFVTRNSDNYYTGTLKKEEYCG